MSKRIAFVGLSGPLLYDYGSPAEAAPSDMSSSPNPILDSPFGLMLLYDEIWFLCRSLCPNNMRELPFVHFLDEEDRLPNISTIDVTSQAEAFRDDPDAARRFADVRRLFTQYDDVVSSLRIEWGAAPDNHTHGLQIGPLQTSANAVALENILFDLQVLERLKDDYVELFANSFARRYLDSSPALNSLDLTQLLIVDRIPNWQSPAGPYHPVLDEVRESPYLKEFREWVVSAGNDTEAVDITEVKDQVEAALDEAKRTLLLRYLEEHRLFYATGKTVLATAGDLLIPFVGTGSALIQDVKEARAAKRLRWQGFLVDVELRASKADGR